MGQMTAVASLLLVAVLRTAAGAVEEADAAPSTVHMTGQCLVCHGSAEFGVAREDGEWASLFVDGRRFASSVHGDLDCTSCHCDMAEGVHLRSGIDDAKVRAVVDVLAHVPTNAPVALATCVACHEDEFEEYRDSVHGRGALEGNVDVPICTDCHGGHYVRAADDLQSTVHPAAVVNTCASCHAAEGVVRKYGVTTEQYLTYRESYHGIANQYGSTTVANCASCHPAHDARPASDPLSSVHPDNLPRTCGKCHRWSNPNVAKGKIHVVMAPDVSPLPYYVRLGFKWMTITVMTMLCGHIALDLFRRALSQRPR